MNTKLPALTFLFLIYSTTAFAQNNPCNMYWGPWETALSDQAGKIAFEVQHADCRSGTTCGWPIIALRSTFSQPVGITLKLKGTQCDGKVISSFFHASGLSDNKELRDPGNSHSFHSVTAILMIEVNYKIGNDLYKIVEDNERGIHETYINGKTKSQISKEIADLRAKYQSTKTSLVDRFQNVSAQAKSNSAANKEYLNGLISQFRALSVDASTLLNRPYFDMKDADAVDGDLLKMTVINTSIESEAAKSNSRSSYAQSGNTNTSNNSASTSSSNNSSDNSTKKRSTYSSDDYDNAPTPKFTGAANDLADATSTLAAILMGGGGVSSDNPSSTAFINKSTNAFNSGSKFEKKGDEEFDKGKYQKAFDYYTKSLKHYSIYVSQQKASYNWVNDESEEQEPLKKYFLKDHQKYLDNAVAIYNAVLDKMKKTGALIGKN